MAITSRAQDKFAFLFTGPTLPRFMADLQNVFATLTNYYNYPAANITIVLGSTPSVAPSFPGATVVNIATAADLLTELGTFRTAATGPAAGMAGFSKSALLYFTGGGDNSTGTAKLLTDGGLPTATNTVDATQLAPLFAITDCHVNVIMQQAFAGAFSTAMSGPEWSFTSACTATEGSLGNNTIGSFFTYGWCKAMQYETLPAGTPNAGEFADTLGPLAGEMNNNLISLNEAREFGTQIQASLGFGGAGTPGHSSAGGGQYLGVPDFLIRDGVTQWWESPDIFLTHPNHTEPAGDLYIPDAAGAIPPFNNTITIAVRNVGTHPVRQYSLGIELFKTGTGPTTDQHTINNRVPAGGLLLPILNPADIGTGNPGDRKDLAEWNTSFLVGTTHECIKAEAKVLPSGVDFTWSIQANDFEGQRNTDELPMAMMAANAQAAGAALQGVKQHEYGIHNRFDERHRFAVMFPPDYQKLTAAFDLTWFVKAERGDELKPIQIVEGRRPHILLTVNARQTSTLVVRAQTRRGAKATRGEIRLPFAILVEGEFPEKRRAIGFDPKIIEAIFADNDNAANLAAMGGFTVVLRHAAATLTGMVLDRKNRPAAGAAITVATVNGLQRAVVTTDANGRYELANVNPDVYRVVAETDNFRSAAQTVVVSDRERNTLDLRLTEDATPAGTRVKVILDRIRIKRDLEPQIKGKADLAFTTVVVPDFDDAAKQVTRLPRKGVIAVSDKPGMNEISLGTTVFDGVVKSDALTIRIDGKELDLFDRDDELTPYQRSFTGSPDSWAGNYQPGDELMDREEAAEWAVWYRIVT